MKAKIEDIIEAIDATDDEMAYYFDMETGSVLFIHDGEIFGEGDVEDMSEEEIEENTTRFLPLPSSFDINDWHTMESFIWDLPEGDEKYILNNDIHRSGAFRRFREDVARFDLLDRWYEFKNDAHRRIAEEWCEENGIDWE